MGKFMTTKKKKSKKRDKKEGQFLMGTVITGITWITGLSVIMGCLPLLARHAPPPSDL